MTRFHILQDGSDRYTLCGKSVLDPGNDAVGDEHFPVNCKLCLSLAKTFVVGMRVTVTKEGAKPLTGVIISRGYNAWNVKLDAASAKWQNETHIVAMDSELAGVR